MKQRLPALVVLLALCLAAPLSHAWNAAGHRLTAVIAWQQLSPPTQQRIADILAQHPDVARWTLKAKSDHAWSIFAEAATWPDDIRSDPRFHDDADATQPMPGFPDNAKHKDWHYVDLDANGDVKSGQLAQKIEELTQSLRSTANKCSFFYALPWLIHLVGDIHQPLHVGRHGDSGGNDVEIENPFNPRLPFSSLHTYWDDLPGPPWLRGKRLAQQAAHLIATRRPPPQANVRTWRNESHQLLARAYPNAQGSLLPLITADFHRQAIDIAEQRIVDAGFRLGRLLETIWGEALPSGTPQPDQPAANKSPHATGGSITGGY